MAFGSWIKNLGKKIMNGVKKALPVIKTIGQIATRVVAPGLSNAGKLIGGNAGKFMGNLGNTISTKGGAFNDYVNNVYPKAINASTFSTPMLK